MNQLASLCVLAAALKQVRRPLGRRHDTQFEHKAHAVETVVPMREQDDSWTVSGYFVK